MFASVAAVTLSKPEQQRLIAEIIGCYRGYQDRLNLEEKTYFLSSFYAIRYLVDNLEQFLQTAQRNMRERPEQPDMVKFDGSAFGDDLGHGNEVELHLEYYTPGHPEYNHHPLDVALNFIVNRFLQGFIQCRDQGKATDWLHTFPKDEGCLDGRLEWQYIIVCRQLSPTKDKIETAIEDILDTYLRTLIENDVSQNLQHKGVYEWKEIQPGQKFSRHELYYLCNYDRISEFISKYIKETYGERGYVLSTGVPLTNSDIEDFLKNILLLSDYEEQAQEILKDLNHIKDRLTDKEPADRIWISYRVLVKYLEFVAREGLGNIAYEKYLSQPFARMYGFMRERTSFIQSPAVGASTSDIQAWLSSSRGASTSSESSMSSSEVESVALGSTSSADMSVASAAILGSGAEFVSSSAVTISSSSPSFSLSMATSPMRFFRKPQIGEVDDPKIAEHLETIWKAIENAQNHLNKASDTSSSLGGIAKRTYHLAEAKDNYRLAIKLTQDEILKGQSHQILVATINFNIAINTIANHYQALTEPEWYTRNECPQPRW